MKLCRGIQCKLIVLLCAAVGFSLLLAGGVLLAVFVDLHSQYAHEQMATAAATLKQEFLSREQELLRLSTLAASREDVVASMNLISEYQDIDAYQSVLFDVEKQRIATEMGQLIRTTRIAYIAVYDAADRLSAFVSERPEGVQMGITSYRGGAPCVLTAPLAAPDDWKTVSMPPLIAATCTKTLPTDTMLHYHAAGSGAMMEVVTPILRRLPDGIEQPVGCLRTVKLLDAAFLNEMTRIIHVRVQLLTVSGSAGSFPYPDFSPQFDRDRVPSLFVPDAAQQTPWIDHAVYFLQAYALPLTSGGPAAYLVLGTDKTLLTSALRRTISILAAVLIVSALMISVIGIVAVNRMIIHPVLSLTHAVEALKAGQYQLIAVKRADQIGRLARAFQSMAITIQRREQEIRTYQEHLEDLVEQRTYALEAENRERRQMEVALQESRARYMQAERIAHFGHWERNFADESGYWSDEVYQIFGVDPAEFEPSFENMLNLLHPDDRDELSELMQQIGQAEGRVDIEYRVIRPDGAERTVHSVAEVAYDGHGRPLKLIGVLHDITDQRRAEEQIRKLSTAVEQNPSVIMITDAQNVIEYVNPKFTQLTGYAAGEALGNTPRFLRADHQPEERYQRLRDTILAGREWQGELLNKKKTGDLYWEFASISSIRDRRGRITHFVKVAEDVTARKQAEAELLRAKEAAEVSNRAKSEFLANMSHELRTPLNGILGYTQILRHDAAVQGEQRRAIDTIHRSGEHLLTMINDILDLSKIEAGKVSITLAPLSLPACLDTVVGVIRMRALQKGIDFVYEPDADLPLYIVSDETRLRQVLLNLLSNAVKFTEQGRVTFRVTRDPHASATPQPSTTPALQPSTTPALQRSTIPSLHFVISDTGIGIPPDMLDTIFLPFEQVHTVRVYTEGTGLGLAISRKIVRLLGSELHVSSAPDEGSAFWFDLNVVEAGHEAEAGQDRAWDDITAYTGTPRTILVVDDVSANRAMLKDLLMPLGFEVLEAADGESALRQCADWQPDLVLMDLVMPGLDGFETTRRMRALPQLQQTPIIGVSASVFETTREASRAASCDAFLTKPLDVSMLLNILARSLELEWVYARDAAPAPAADCDTISCAAPPLEELTRLLQDADVGDLQAIQAHARQLAHDNPQWQTFAERLLELTNTFQPSKVRTFLEHMMSTLD